MQAGIDLGPLGSVSTETLNKLGKRISINEIQVGDIIFLEYLQKRWSRRNLYWKR